ncbi:DUF4129 domain-containing protein [Nocardia asteroides]|uniref:DUF4129 domain-containing protein n=1 Tax=Nocardia asteroides TaxID=1824 RepID=UPI00341FDFD8
MIGLWAPTSRLVGVIVLVAAAVVALNGHLPGVTPARVGSSAPLAVALMPVLLLVSVVILMAGVILSRHRLPLAMPAAESGPVLAVRFGRVGVFAPAAVAAAALVFAGGITLLIVLPGAAGEPRVSPSVGSDAAVVSEPGDAAAVPHDTVTGVPDLNGIALLAVATVAIVLMSSALVGLVGVVMELRRSPSTEAVGVVHAPSSYKLDSLTKAAEMGLAAMNAPGQDPGTAIIACYVAMERGLSGARASAPLASDTPSEMLARAFDIGVLHDDSAHELVDLFEEARFSHHSMLMWQRIRAEQLMRIVLADLRPRTLAPA